MSALARFKRLNADEQEGFIARVRGGLIDAPPQFREMVAWRDAHTFDASVLAGGMTRREWEWHQSLRRAGMVDAPPSPSVPKWRGP